MVGTPTTKMTWSKRLAVAVMARAANAVTGMVMFGENAFGSNPRGREYFPASFFCTLLLLQVGDEEVGDVGDFVESRIGRLGLAFDCVQVVSGSGNHHQPVRNTSLLEG